MPIPCMLKFLKKLGLSSAICGTHLGGGPEITPGRAGVESPIEPAPGRLSAETARQILDVVEIGNLAHSGFALRQLFHHSSVVGVR